MIPLDLITNLWEIQGTKKYVKLHSEYNKPNLDNGKQKDKHFCFFSK